MQIQKIAHEHAQIFVFEGEKFNFEIKRIYFIRDVEAGQVRGHHAHKTLRQVLVCPHGSIRINLDDGKGNRESTVLDTPEKGLYVGPALWRTMEWLESGSLLLVFATQNYEAADYIRNYDEFVTFTRQTSKMTEGDVL